MMRVAHRVLMLWATKKVGAYPVISSQLVDRLPIHLIPKLLADELHNV